MEVRYNTRDHNGQTRAERNRLAGAPVPDYEIPEHGKDIYAMFWNLSAHRVDRNRISPSIIVDWLRVNGKRIEASEMRILEAMDRQFLEALSIEIELNEARRKGQ